MDLGQFLRDSEWYGRENELVNLFAHSFLRGRIGPNGPIDVAQLGIEVAVKQLDEIQGKEVVRKDLVVWSKPNETVWVGRKPLNRYSVCGFIQEHRGVSFMRFSRGAQEYQSFNPGDVLPRRVRKGKFTSDHVRIVEPPAKTP